MKLLSLQEREGRSDVLMEPMKGFDHSSFFKRNTACGNIVFSLTWRKTRYLFLSLALYLYLQTSYHGFRMLYWRHFAFCLILRLMLLLCMMLCTWWLWVSSSFPRWQSAPYSAIDTNPGALGPASWA